MFLLQKQISAAKQVSARQLFAFKINADKKTRKYEHCCQKSHWRTNQHCPWGAGRIWERLDASFNITAEAINTIKEEAKNLINTRNSSRKTPEKVSKYNTKYAERIFWYGKYESLELWREKQIIRKFRAGKPQESPWKFRKTTGGQCRGHPPQSMSHGNDSSWSLRNPKIMSKIWSI